MESDISLSLCSDQTLVKSKQCLVDFIHIVVSPFDKIFYNDIEFARMGKGKPCLTEHLLHLGKRQFQSQSKCQHRRFGWLIEFIRTDLREEFPVNVCLLVALGSPSCRFRQSSAAAFPKSSHQSAPVPPPKIDCCKIYRLLRSGSGAGAASKQDSSDNASSRRLCSARLSVCSSTYRSSMYAAISANSFPLI